MGHFSTNSLQNRSEYVKEAFLNNIDVFDATESKVEETFRSNEFQIKDHKNFQFEKSYYWGNVYMYLNHDIIAMLVECSYLGNIENICSQLNLRKRLLETS